ncbi:hypothetical protein IWX48DRAFT_678278 [Phyllosticta citricarpa]
MLSSESSMMTFLAGCLLGSSSPSVQTRNRGPWRACFAQTRRHSQELTHHQRHRQGLGSSKTFAKPYKRTSATINHRLLHHHQHHNHSRKPLHYYFLSPYLCQLSDLIFITLVQHAFHQHHHGASGPGRHFLLGSHWTRCWQCRCCSGLSASCPGRRRRAPLGQVRSPPERLEPARRPRHGQCQRQRARRAGSSSSFFFSPQAAGPHRRRRKRQRCPRRACAAAF